MRERHVAEHGLDMLAVRAPVMLLAAVQDGQPRDERLGSLDELLLAGTPVGSERDVTRPLVYGELELEVLSELATRAVDNPPVTDLIPERLLGLPAVDPVAQRPSVRALLD